MSRINGRIDAHVACEEPRTRRVLRYLTETPRHATLGGQDGGEPQEASPGGGQNVKKNAKSMTVTLTLDEAEAVFEILNAWLQEQIDTDEPDRTTVNASRALERISRELDRHGEVLS